MRIRPGLMVAIVGLAFSVVLGAEGRLDSVKIEGIPHVRQKPDFCGEACVEMVARKMGKSIDQDQVFNVSGLQPELGRGCWAREMKPALENVGFEPGMVWYHMKSSEADKQLDKLFAEMHADLKAGIPSIVCMKYNMLPNASEHFRLVTGYDSKTDELIYHEPAMDDGAYQRMARKDFIKLWPLKYSQEKWVAIRMRMKSDKLIEPPKVEGFDDAAYAQHILQLRKKLPKGFTIVVSKPFVVIGDEPADTVKMRSEKTVQWSVTRLKQAYFAKDPTRILDIYLFKDKASYEKHCKQFFSITPNTPYGFFSDSQGALVMNIATGGGTLVHEIVHPFVAANFPACPSWFNEGLGSLYEQSGTDGRGRIIGLTNWRLRGLQQAIKADKVPSFKELTQTTTNQFYNMDRGTNYAQARYLCYYLQQKDLLRTYYKKFHENAAGDPTGYKTLAEVLNVKDWDKFKKQWEQWVMKLTFP